MHRWSQRPGSRIIVGMVFALSVVVQLIPEAASAVPSFQAAYVRLDRMKVNTATGALVCAKPATALTEATVVIQFPSTYTLNTTAANWTVTTTNLPTGATAWPGINTATSADNSTKKVTFPSTDLTVATL